MQYGDVFHFHLTTTAHVHNNNITANNNILKTIKTTIAVNHPSIHWSLFYLYIVHNMSIVSYCMYKYMHVKRN